MTSDQRDTRDIVERLAEQRDAHDICAERGSIGAGWIASFLSDVLDFLSEQADEIERLRGERDEAIADSEESDVVLGNVCRSLCDSADRLGLLNPIPDKGSLRSDAAAWDANLFEREIERLRSIEAARDRLAAIVERFAKLPSLDPPSRSKQPWSGGVGHLGPWIARHVNEDERYGPTLTSDYDGPEPVWIGGQCDEVDVQVIVDRLNAAEAAAKGGE